MRDKSAKMQHAQFVLSVFKFLVFYTCVAGILALPTKQGVTTATQLFVVPTVVKVIVGLLEKAAELYKKLRELHKFYKLFGAKRFLEMTALANMLKSARSVTYSSSGAHQLLGAHLTAVFIRRYMRMADYN